MKNHEEFKITCNKCGVTFDKESDLEFHITYDHRPTYQWNCMKCPFQTNDKVSLKNHFDLKRTERQCKLKCKECSGEFNSSWHLKNHIRDEHGQQELCSHFKENKCKFGYRCWKKHIGNPSGQNDSTFTCYTCRENFKNLNMLMTHKKKKHTELCKPCLPKNGTCQFENMPEKCWYLHLDFQVQGGIQVPP